SPRRFFAELSPITQRTASMMLDLPQPLGPTTAAMLLGKLTVVGSTKDLKPARRMHFRRMGRTSGHGSAATRKDSAAGKGRSARLRWRTGKSWAEVCHGLRGAAVYHRVLPAPT